MNYRRIELKDIHEISPFFRYAPWRTCDFTVGGLFMWRDFYRMEYCIREDTLFSRLRDANGVFYHNVPLSENIVHALDLLVDEEESDDGILRFCTVPEDCLAIFSEHYDVRSIVKEYNLADYLYLAESMTALSGRKLSGQRNQIHQFERENTNWSFTPIGAEHLESVRQFLTDEYHVSENASLFEIEENKKVMEVIDNYDLYQFLGGVLMADGKMIGFSMGEILGDTIYIHIEKSIRDKKGSYQMLTNQFLKHYCTDKIVYVNREEDMGDEGLRRSKNAYHPLKVLRKYTVEVRL